MCSLREMIERKVVQAEADALRWAEIWAIHGPIECIHSYASLHFGPGLSELFWVLKYFKEKFKKGMF